MPPTGKKRALDAVGVQEKPVKVRVLSKQAVIDSNIAKKVLSELLGQPAAPETQAPEPRKKGRQNRKAGTSEPPEFCFVSSYCPRRAAPIFI